MRVIVTGATSFIGSHAVQALVSQGFEVCALIRSNSAGKKNLEQMIIKKELLEIIECELSGLKELAVNAEKLSKIGQKWSHDLGRADYWLHLGWDGSGSDNRKLADIQSMNAVYALDALETAAAAHCKRFLLWLQQSMKRNTTIERQTSYIRFLSMERLRLCGKRGYYA
ncbi:MAG: NAD-dependent epimerase/dehydratase family protein [Lachnospiraceae bacterium]